MEKVEVNLDRVKRTPYFEFREIVDEVDPYQALQGINCTFDNNSILKFKNKNISFELDIVRLVSLLYPYEGEIYT